MLHMLKTVRPLAAFTISA